MSSLYSIDDCYNLDHVDLLKATTRGYEREVQRLLNQRSWLSKTDQDALRRSLQIAAKKGDIAIMQFLMDQGAEVNSKGDTETSAIIKASAGGHTGACRLLLDRGANINAKDRYGRTALYTSAFRGYLETVQLLLANGLDVNAQDYHRRTVLHFLASETWLSQVQANGLNDVIQSIISSGASVETPDDTGRTPLHWCAATGKIEYAKILLSGNFGNRANVSAQNERGRTALHFASEKCQLLIAKLLLANGANVSATSDGGWTPLHHAALKGNTSLTAMLLEAGAKVNAQLYNGATPLHLSAAAGHKEATETLMDHELTNFMIKDNHGRTPMICAAEKHHRVLVHILSPARNGHRLTRQALKACEQCEATIVDFGHFRHGKKQIVFKRSVYELLYSWKSASYNIPTVSTLVKNVKHTPAFRWIHLPANNVAWLEVLLSKWFTEGDHSNIDDFKAAEKAFDREHRGLTAHGHFMEPLCKQAKSSKPKPSQRNTNTPSHTSDNEMRRRPPSDRYRDHIPAPTEIKVNAIEVDLAMEEEVRGRSGKVHKRKTKSQIEPRLKTQSHQIDSLTILFMPYLHYETDSGREHMNEAIQRKMLDRNVVPESHTSSDDLLISAYLHESPSLHARRTLDQSFYPGIDTSARDRDQVVFRHFQKLGREPKIFMVDQLWLIILGEGLIITSFPQRWKQPEFDPFNVLSNLFGALNSSITPVQTVSELAVLIASECSSMLRKSRLVRGQTHYPSLDIFELTLGELTLQESIVTSRFSAASKQAQRWLAKDHKNRAKVSTKRDDEDNAFVDDFINVGTETSLLIEVQDIRDELNMISMVLGMQIRVLTEFSLIITDPSIEGHSTKGTDLQKISSDLMQLLELSRRNVEKMDQQAMRLYMSISNVLDIKQKNASVFETRFARHQAAVSVRQSQAVMLFTVVTIIFLPMSLIAAFFAINLEAFPHNSDGSTTVSLRLVSKYVFGIGMAISVSLISMAFAVDRIERQIHKYFSGTMNFMTLSKSKI